MRSSGSRMLVGGLISPPAPHPLKGEHKAREIGTGDAADAGAVAAKGAESECL